VIALAGCDISHPVGFEGGVEIVRASHAMRSFPTRVSTSLGLCFKQGPPHRVLCDGREVTYPRDTVCIRLPGCVWSSELSPAAFTSIDIAPQFLPPEIAYRPMQFLQAKDLAHVGGLIDRIESGRVPLSRHEALAQLVATLVRPSHRGAISRNAVVRARDFLATSISQAPSLDELAAAAGCDKFTLIRSFRRCLGITPYAYFVRLRIEKARALLAAGALSVAIAAQLGFADQAHFSRQFKRIVGLTPAAYARQVRHSWLSI
jgi:AraC-like DNA-binding protein